MNLPGDSKQEIYHFLSGSSHRLLIQRRILLLLNITQYWVKFDLSVMDLRFFFFLVFGTNFGGSGLTKDRLGGMG